MEENRSKGNGKRPFLEDDDSNSSKPPQKRVRFPKGRKVKAGDEATIKRSVVEDEGPVDLTDPRLAAKERAKRRTHFTSQLFIDDAKADAEETYKDNENFVEDGIQIDPFNLDKEREEGYFDAAGNFVEYVNENEIKDAWLDSVQVDTSLASKISVSANDEDDNQELSSEEIGRIKRRIADALEPGENVLQALKRLKGNSSNRKEKMSAETKHLFDQLTEGAMLLMENGEYDVYHEKQEVFQREAEGYERLVFARSGGAAIAAKISESETRVGTNLLGEGSDAGLASSLFDETAVAPSVLNESRAHISNGDGEEYDMFAEDDEQAASNPTTEGAMLDSHVNGTSGPSASDSQSDYVYDENSGYYYSSSLGYYYDPSTGFYCSAASGQWYAFNEETGTYEEIRTDASNAN